MAKYCYNCGKQLGREKYCRQCGTDTSPERDVFLLRKVVATVMLIFPIHCI